MWALHGEKTLTGREAFAAEADSAGGPNPQLHLDRVIEEGDTVAVVGHGSVDLGTGDPVDFVYSEVFTFRDGPGEQVGHVPRLAWRGAGR